MDDNELVQYFLVNRDLSMNKGKIAAQVAHASCIYTYYHHNEPNFQKWFHSVQKKVTLKAPQELLEELEKQGHLAIRDKGYTQIPENSLTVVTLGVTTREEVYDIVKDLSLL